MSSLRRPSHLPSGPPSKGPPPPMPRAPSSGNDIERRRDARKSRVGDAIRRRMSMRYAGPEQLFDSAPPLPGTTHFLDADPYGGMATREDEEDDRLRERETGDSKFAQFGSGDFARSGFGTGAASASASSGVGGGRSGAASRSAGEEGIRRRGAVDTSREDEWDFDEMGKEGFDLQAFIKKSLAGANEEERKRFRVALERMRQGNQRELQRNVFKHYAEFVNMSKEISTLEHDMLELKELLGQWKDLPQLMGMDDTLAPTLDKSGNVERKRTMRNSVLDLQQVYKAQLTTLWSTVEGSQKYIPVAPGRHLVFETHTFVELNAATYKAKQSVSLFLLSDLLLIAGRRRTKTAATPDLGGEGKVRERGRMVAERCWVLADLVVIDVKDSGDLTNALKIRRGKEVCVYRSSKSEDKKALLAAFRQVSQELGEKKRKESEKEQERRRTMWMGGGGSAPPDKEKAGLLASSRPLSMIGTSLADSKDLRWIDDFGDELTMAIATRNWDEAVIQVEKGQELLKIAAPNPSALSLLTGRLASLRATLVSSLAADLAYPGIRKSRTVHLTGLLMRLDQAHLARDSFLGARHDLIIKRVRAIRAEGDISLYVSELAVVCFTVVRNTGDWYMTAFKENKAASGFVTWAKKQIEVFAEMFRRQVYAPNVPADVVDECLKVTASHSRKLLRDVGLDFTFLLTTLLQPPSSASSNNRSSLPTFSFPTATPGPNSAYAIQPSPFGGYSMLDTPGFGAGPGGTPSPGAGSGSGQDMEDLLDGYGGPSPSDRAEDPFGREMEREGSSASGAGSGRYAPEQPGRRTAPLSVRKNAGGASRGGMDSPGSAGAGAGFSADMGRMPSR